MRSVLSLLVVGLLTTTASAQFGNVGSTNRKTAPPAADAAPKKAASEKAHGGKAAPKDAADDSAMVDALLAAMDTDHDGVVTKIEMNKAMAALRKVHKDSKGNMTVPDNAAADTTASQAAEAGPGQGNAASNAGGDPRNNNEATAWFVGYDKNGDGRLSENEVPPQMRAGLQGADLNGDGFIDAREFQAFSRKLGERAKAFSAGVNPNRVPGNGRTPKP